MILTYQQYDKMIDTFEKVDYPEQIKYPSIAETKEYLEAIDDDGIQFLMWLSTVLPAPQTESEQTVSKMISKELLKNVVLTDEK